MPVCDTDLRFVLCWLFFREEKTHITLDNHRTRNCHTTRVGISISAVDLWKSMVEKHACRRRASFFSSPLKREPLFSFPATGGSRPSGTPGWLDAYVGTAPAVASSPEVEVSTEGD